jgi:2-(3-amino-3-carboxypropyl)histidine synthase
MKNIFDFEEDKLKEEIAKRKAKQVLLQLPEGLKIHGPSLAKTVKEMGALAIVSADPCYGACDLALREAEDLDADLIVHFGHSQMERQKGKVPVVFVDAKAKIDVKDAVKKAFPYIKDWKRIGLVTSVQHAHLLDEARKELVKIGKTVAIADSGQLKHPGQVTGCNYSNAQSISKEVEAFMVISGGKFHAVGVALATSKPTIAVDPYENQVYNVEEETKKILKQRWACIEEARQTEEFGVLVGLKTGQKRIDKALEIQKKLEQHGKEAVLLALREITPEALMQFPTLDAFVNTACPRLALDDAERFRKPILSVNEALVMMGEMNWDDLCKKGWFENVT